MFLSPKPTFTHTCARTHTNTHTPLPTDRAHSFLSLDELTDTEKWGSRGPQYLEQPGPGEAEEHRHYAKV